MDFAEYNFVPVEMESGMEVMLVAVAIWAIGLWSLYVRLESKAHRGWDPITGSYINMMPIHKSRKILIQLGKCQLCNKTFKVLHVE